ncbi:ABC transporter substrate-binding protein [Clostridioides mangenotii]|uniref:ABC transporter substrate-binding protein n=1 Tax=Metaclostridioides mangenotii TaxID=1540 RepID=UPI001C127ECE|nr:ABC transporter substrate-binding protein [Clostridioides mangenotii]MBU5307606.1 ABC transporter substrate-binding protein [Clostridioides mangenotii]
MKKLKMIIATLVTVVLVSGCSSNKLTGKNNEENKVYNDSKYINLTMVKPKTINPIINNEESVSHIMNLVYDGLFEIDKNYNVETRLVKEYTTSSDGMSIDIELTDAKWHDGKEVTATDVSYTIDLINKTPESIYKSLTENIASTTVTSSKNLTIKFKTSEAFPTNKLVFPIVSSDLGTKGIDANKKNLIGNGQYKVESYSEREDMVLTANDNYYIDQPKNIKQIKVKIVPDEEARVSMVMSLDSDITDVTINDLSKFQEDKFNITKYQGREFEFVSFNYNKSYLQNKDFRKAIAHSVNRKNLLEEGYMGDAQMVNFPLNTKSEYYNDKIGQLEFSKDKAQSYLDKVKFTGEDDKDSNKKVDDNQVNTHKNNDEKEVANSNNKSGIQNSKADKNLEAEDQNDKDAKNDSKKASDGEVDKNIVDNKNSKKSNNQKIKSLDDINLKIVVNKDNIERVKTANLISANLKTVGINSTVEQLSAEDLEKAMNTNNYDLAVTGWVLSNVPNVKEIIAYSGYSDEKLTEYMNQIEKETSKDKIRDLYGKMQKNINDNVGFISLVVRNNHIVTNNRLDGKIEPNDFDVYEGIANLNIKTNK